jgi:hypothetical protein
MRPPSILTLEKRKGAMFGLGEKKRGCEVNH